MDELARHEDFEDAPAMYRCLYQAWSMSIPAIADLLGVGVGTVHRHLQRYGIKTRPVGPAGYPGNKRLPAWKRQRLYVLLGKGLSRRVISIRLGIDYYTVARYDRLRGAT